MSIEQCYPITSEDGSLCAGQGVGKICKVVCSAMGQKKRLDADDLVALEDRLQLALVCIDLYVCMYVSICRYV